MSEAKTNKEQVNRRSFLKKSWGWLGIIAGIEFTAIMGNFLWPGKKSAAATTGNTIFSIGRSDQIINGSVIPFTNGRFYFVRLMDGGMLAVSIHCTHLGCSISYNNQKEEFICPCHASSFDVTGNVLNPPAPRALDLYHVFIDQGEVKVDTGKLTKRKNYTPGDLVYA